jgi:hypothetical protein
MPVTLAAPRELTLVPVFHVKNAEELERLQNEFSQFKRRFELASYIGEDKVINVFVSNEYTTLSERTVITVCACKITLRDTRDLGEVWSSPVETFYRFGNGIKAQIFVIRNTMPK